jgi:hypothetical protein
MYGTDPACVFLVFCNPSDGGDEALDHWYMKIHGPDALENGSFSALHRYEARGDHPARFLAVWEGSFTTMQAARAYIAPRADELRRQGRVTDDMTVTWALMGFRTSTTSAPPVKPRTLTLVEGAAPELTPPPGRTYVYGDVVLHESDQAVDVVRTRWADLGRPGPAPRGAYRSIFDAPGPNGTLANPAVDGTWVSHWRPIGSLTMTDLGLGYAPTSD